MLKLVLVLVFLLLLSGCATPMYKLDLDRVYELEDGMVIKVYETNHETIYVCEKGLSIVKVD